MEQPKSSEFTAAKASGVGMASAISIAKSEIAVLSDAAFDAVSQCQRQGDGRWTVDLELIESPARMGENDLLVTYKMHIDADGCVVQVDRLGRYRREDGAIA